MILLPYSFIHFNLYLLIAYIIIQRVQDWQCEVQGEPLCVRVFRMMEPPPKKRKMSLFSPLCLSFYTWRKHTVFFCAWCQTSDLFIFFRKNILLHYYYSYKYRKSSRRKKKRFILNIMMAIWAAWVRLCRFFENRDGVCV